MVAILDVLTAGSWQLRDPRFWSVVAAAFLVAVVLVKRWHSWCRFWRVLSSEPSSTSVLAIAPPIPSWDVW